MKKRLLTFFLTLILILGLTACENKGTVNITHQINNQNFAQYHANANKGTLTLQDTQGLTKIGENDYLQVFYNNETLILTIFDRRTGKCYSSTPDSEEISSSNNSLAMLSLIYSDFQGKSGEIDSYTKSVALEQVEIENGNNECIFNYKIGDFSDGLEVTPKKISGKRFEELLKKTDSSSERILKRRYGYADETDQWIRRTNIVNPNAISQLVEIFKEIGYTEEDLIKDNEENGVKTEVIEKLGFFIPLKVSLEEDSVIISIDFEKITYPENNKLTKIKVLPLFGATSGDSDGYFLLPDGSGAIMPFATVKSGEIGYNASVYGNDYAMRIKTEGSEKQNVLLPVFGAGYKNGGYLAYIEEGEALADIIANNSGAVDEYNEIYSQVNFLKTESVALGNQNTSDNFNYYHFQENPYCGKYVLRYIFCDNDSYDYSGMAGMCRNYLISTGRLNENPNLIDEAAPFVLETVGGILSEQNLLGFTYKGITPLTKYEDNLIMANKLKDVGVENINIRLTAFQGDGIQNKLPLKLELISKLGGKNGFAKLITNAATAAINIFPDFQYTTFTGNSGIFVKNSYAAKTLDMKAASREVINSVTLRKDTQISDNIYYLTSIDAFDKINESIKTQLNKYEILNISLADLGGNISSDFSDNVPYDRQSAVNKANNIINDLSNKYGVMTVAPSVNAASNSNIIIEAPIWSSQYSFSKGIPFYSMVFHGLINYTGKSLNLTSDRQTEFLRSIEYGALLKYTLAYRNTDIIKYSDYTYLFSSSFEQNIDDIKEKYKIVNELYKKISNSKMISHEAINDNIYMTVYENGIKTLVNYSDNDFSYSGLIVPARDFVTVEKGIE